MVKEITAFQFTQSFRKAFRPLPREIQVAFEKKLRLFLQDCNHPSLRVKRIQGTRDRWEGSITMKYRFTFQIIDDCIVFRNIGTHAILERKSRKG